MSTICRWPWLPRQVPQKEVTLTTLAVMEISDEDSLETQGEPRWPKHMGRGTQSQKATIKVSGHRHGHLSQNLRRSSMAAAGDGGDFTHSMKRACSMPPSSSQ